MQYMCLIYSAEDNRPNHSDAETATVMQRYMEFGKEMQANGKLIAGDALQPVSTATTISVRDGKTQTTDGPFAETKEQLGGYYLLECNDLDDALACAAKIPASEYGRIEVRPLMVFE